MKTISLSLVAAALLALAACSGTAKSTADGKAAQAPIQDAFAIAPVSGANYGAGVPERARVMDYATFVKTVQDKGAAEATVEGTVVEVCQKKGCWMTLEPTGGDEQVTVRFKDYGFFMPKTLSGSRVVVQGMAKRTEVSVADLRHYAEDAGKSAEEIAAITEPEMEVELTATGVRVL